MEGSESRLEINVPLLDKILELRRRIASILGYKTWCVRFSFLFSKVGTNKTSRADYKTEVKMIKTGNGIEEASNQMIYFPSDSDYYFPVRK
jgi:metallopeptidase MepB